MFRKIGLTLIVPILAILVISCSDKPKSSYLDEKITKDNLYTLASKISEENKMTTEDASLFTGAVNRLGIVPDSIIGKTIGELIQNENEFQKRNAYNQMTSTFAKAEILMNHKIKYLGLKPFDTLDKSYDYLVFEITNTADKDIANLIGQLRFFNQNNQLIKAYPVDLSKVMKNNETIKKGDTRRFVYPFYHDKENQRDEIVRNGKDLQVLWYPITMVYSDSTKVTAEIKNNNK